MFYFAFQVTGDNNVFAGKISVKCLLDYPVNATSEEQRSIKSLASLPKVKRTDKLHELPAQKFILPDDDDMEGPYAIRVPRYSQGRLVRDSKPPFL